MYIILFFEIHMRVKEVALGQLHSVGPGQPFPKLLINSTYIPWSFTEDIYVNFRQNDGISFMHEFGSWTGIRRKQ